MRQAFSQLPPQLPSFLHALVLLPVAAGLGAMLGLVRPIRRSLVPRSSHVIQTQVLLAIVGAGVLLVALAAGLAVGSGLLLLATIASGFVVAVLWVLESFEPPDHARFDLTIDTKDTAELRPRIEHALRQKGVRYELWGSSPARLRYEVTLPLHLKTQKLSRIIKKLNGHNGTSVEWNIKKVKTVQT